MTDEAPVPHMLVGSLDEIMADFDTVMPLDADAVVEAYVQAGGNGGGESAALLQEWMSTLGGAEARDVMLTLGALTEDLESSGVDTDARIMLRGFPARRGTGWGFDLLCLRYGYPTASYWLDAKQEVPALNETGRQFLDTLRDDETARETYIHILRLERAVRSAERREHFADAQAHLYLLLSATAEIPVRLADEYKHLLGTSEFDLGDPASSATHYQRLYVRVKELVAPIPSSSGNYRPAEKTDRSAEDVHLTGRAQAPARKARAASPVRAGQTLEMAALGLLRRLFDIGREQASILSPLLRRQGGGYQFGHDLSFDTEVVGSGQVRCHIECKNYTRRVGIDDIAGKLVQQKHAATSSPIDHWILISPHEDPANDLQEFLQTWEQTEEWGFSVQVWSPQSGVQDWFATAPDIYKLLYDADPPSVDAGQVTRQFIGRIAPRPRIPRAFRDYLRDPQRMCFATEDASHFIALLDDHAEIGAVDAIGRPVGQTLLEAVTSWLEAPEPGALLLLGEFGDGKSFFTFQLCQKLSEDFLALPEEAMYPVRLSLKDLHQAGSPDALITRWLDGIGATRVEWNSLAASRPTLIVLDGFDEMTSALDPPTVHRNLELLTSALETLAGPVTDANRKRKVIVTSRGRFFDQPREESVLRERLHNPQLMRIRPLSRIDVLANLSTYAKRIGATAKLSRIRTLYDPIGLAGKPLFLQMIKETLLDLPDDEFNAATLYETYITQSLQRKADLLRSGQPYELASDIIGRLRSILEKVAVQFQLTGADSVDLREVTPDGKMAELLWEMTGQPSAVIPEAAVHDARTRVSIRSLLRPIPADDDTWQVTFFHKSIAEYFLATAIARELVDVNLPAVRTILDGNSLSVETMDFVVPALPADHRPAAVQLLVTLAGSSRRGSRTATFLGGNSACLCYLIEGTMPDSDWRDLNLDGVRLVGADLRGRDLSGSSLRYATLDNADLRDANLENTDLTGLRIEQTSQVAAVAIDAENGTILVAYTDGSIREWFPVGARWSSHAILSGLDSAVLAVVPMNSATAVAVTLHEVLVLARTRPEWTLSCRTPRSPFLAGLYANTEGICAVHGGSQPVLAQWRADTDAVSIMAVSQIPALVNVITGLSGNTALSDRAIINGEWLMSRFFVGGKSRPTLWHIPSGQSWRVSEADISAFTVAVTDTARILFAGTYDGHLWHAMIDGEAILNLVPFAVGGHDGPITCVAANGDSFVVTGGVDRCVRIWRVGEDGGTITPLYLTLRCAGACIDGVKGPGERRMLQFLAEHDLSDGIV